MREAGLASRIILQIHDELVVEVAPGEAERVTALVKDAMEHAVDMAVPLDVSIGYWFRIGSLPRTDTVLGFVCAVDVRGRAMA